MVTLWTKIKEGVEHPHSILPRNLLLPRRGSGAIRVSPHLLQAASVAPAEVLSALKTGTEGLTEAEAQRRLAEYGPNVVAQEPRRADSADWAMFDGGYLYGWPW